MTPHVSKLSVVELSKKKTKKTTTVDCSRRDLAIGGELCIEDQYLTPLEVKRFFFAKSAIFQLGKPIA